MKFRIRITGEMSASQHFAEFKRDAKRLWQQAESGDLSEGYEREIGVPNLSWLAKILSPEKVRLIAMIQERNPQSLYELAQLLNRETANIHRDVYELAEYGILRLERTQREGREQDVVRPEFPWEGFEIQFQKKKDGQAA